MLSNLTPQVIGWVTQTLPEADVDVVIGPLYKNSKDVEIAASRSKRVHLHPDPDIGSLIRACDIAVSGGGQTTYELAATGTPAVAIRVAQNQTLNLRGLSGARTLIWAGDAADKELGGKVVRSLSELANSSSLRNELGTNGRNLVDGRGAIRVAEKIFEMTSKL